VTLGVVFSLFSVWRQQAGFHADANSQLPATSWIAMSLNPKYSGQYDNNLYLYLLHLVSIAAQKCYF